MSTIIFTLSAVFKLSMVLSSYYTEMASGSRCGLSCNYLWYFQMIAPLGLLGGAIYTPVAIISGISR